MLVKKDLEQIKSLVEETVQKSVKAGFTDFYENIFLPHAERSEEHMVQSKRITKKLRNS